MATLAQTGIPGVGNGILMPMRKNLWRVTFQGIAANQGDSKDLSMQATNITKPNTTWEQIEVHRYNSVAYVAGKHTFEPVSLTVENDIGTKAGAIIMDQMEAQQQLVGADGPYLASAASASAYKFGTKLEMLDGEDRVLERWIMEGCWFTSVDFGDLDYSSSEASQIIMQIRYDHARLELEGSGAGTATGGNV